MNLQNILSEIEKVDPDLEERMGSRRSALRDFAHLGGKVALTALPLALGSFFNKSYGQSTNATVLEILNYALTLEYLEAEFYATALTKTSITFPTDAAKAAITKIKNDEAAHVTFLKTAIAGAGGTAIAKPTFNFENNATFGNVFLNYTTFLAVAQAFEDTGVRAYKGRAKELVKGGAYLTAALNIHSVEARHASHIRQMRRAAAGGGQTAMKPWITGANDSGIGASVNAVYAGEDNTVQGGVTITNLAGVSGNISVNAATEAFDEPLSKAEVLVIANLFITA
ncbi:Ferritin-like domain-containing protein [Filimonas lacunae]|uniref:Ferritin-like domain-containing protein n=1 Tax=Filimonas lacunae TaxID=477680 RepID=A0A173MIZ7_9BACT|nr:ferritin-like domain-containing protein [Filimonas lacunae]BAV07436.1 hypothetical protein FLA_3461 [Filimonas lacunae]SIT30378.1 Ferritin-like domain-containing protein [Filimonas lacunae]